MNYSVAMYGTYWMTVKSIKSHFWYSYQNSQIHAGICDFNDDKEIYCCWPREDGIRARYSTFYRTLATKVPALRDLVNELAKGGVLKDVRSC